MLEQTNTPKYSVLPREFIESPNTTIEEIKVLSYLTANKGRTITQKAIAKGLEVPVSRVITCLNKLAKKNILVIYGGLGVPKNYRIKNVEMWSV